jgi:hypothetical protein
VTPVKRVVREAGLKEKVVAADVTGVTTETVPSKATGEYWVFKLKRPIEKVADDENQALNVTSDMVEAVVVNAT